MARHLGRIRSLERQYAHEIAEVALDNFLEFVDYNWYRHAAYNRGDGRAFVQMSGVLDTGLEGIYKVADYLDRCAAERRFPHPRAITRIVLPWRRDLIHAYRGNDPLPFDPPPPEPEPDPEPEPPAPAPQPEPSSTPSDAPARVLIRRERLLLAAFRPGAIPNPRPVHPRPIQTRNPERPRGRSPPSQKPTLSAAEGWGQPFEPPNAANVLESPQQGGCDDYHRTRRYCHCHRHLLS